MEPCHPLSGSIYRRPARQPATPRSPSSSHTDLQTERGIRVRLCARVAAPSRHVPLSDGKDSPCWHSGGPASIATRHPHRTRRTSASAHSSVGSVPPVSTNDWATSVPTAEAASCPSYLTVASDRRETGRTTTLSAHIRPPPRSGTARSISPLTSPSRAPIRSIPPEQR